MKWRPVVGYESLYQVSDTGLVKSLQRTTRFGQVIKTRILKPAFAGPGKYLHVTLCKNGIMKPYYIHTLVLNAFVGPRPEGMECRHLDGKNYRNRLEFLAWGTRAENSKDTVIHGHWKNPGKFGAAHHKAKLSELQVQFIRHSPYPPFVLAEFFGVNWSTIDRIQKGETWKSLL